MHYVLDIRLEKHCEMSSFVFLVGIITDKNRTVLLENFLDNTLHKVAIE